MPQRLVQGGVSFSRISAVCREALQRSTNATRQSLHSSLSLSLSLASPAQHFILHGTSLDLPTSSSLSWSVCWQRCKRPTRLATSLETSDHCVILRRDGHDHSPASGSQLCGNNELLMCDASRRMACHRSHALDLGIRNDTNSSGKQHVDQQLIMCPQERLDALTTLALKSQPTALLHWTAVKSCNDSFHMSTRKTRCLDNLRRTGGLMSFAA
jgi:hypothetical protein